MPDQAVRENLIEGEGMICEVCGTRQATERHHKLSQTKLYKKLYGELIHNKKNLVDICYQCHHNEAVPKWSEKEFCDALGIQPRSKTERSRKY